MSSRSPTDTDVIRRPSESARSWPTGRCSVRHHRGVPPADRLTFRPLAEVDLELVAAWLATPHVRAWWRAPADIESVRAKYLPRIRGDEPTEVFVASLDDEPI